MKWPWSKKKDKSGRTVEVHGVVKISEPPEDELAKKRAPRSRDIPDQLDDTVNDLKRTGERLAAMAESLRVDRGVFVDDSG